VWQVVDCGWGRHYKEGMKIVRDIAGLPEMLKGAAVAIGNFDGVHLGHRDVLALMKARAEAVKAPKAVLTFEPHPRSYFDKEAAPKKLTSLAEKLRLFREEGVDIVYILRFNQALAELPAEHFIHQVLAQQLAIRDVTTGDAFVFGKGRLGTAKLIKAGAEYSGKYTANTVPARMQAGSPVSSSRIRALLAVGKVEEVAALLGRDYTLRGPVIAGDKRARGLGYPTANIALAPFRAVPAYGVYAVDVQRPGSEVWERGIANLGVRPTFGGGRALLEVHLLGQSLNLYGQRLTVRFLHRLREEKKFENMAQLAAQIARDAAAVKAWFKAREEAAHA